MNKFLPLSIQALNTINHYKKEGFTEFSFFDDGNAFGLKFGNDTEDGYALIRCNDKEQRVEYVKSFKLALNNK